MPSEGAAVDLIGVATTAQAEHARAEGETQELKARHEQALRAAADKYLETDVALEDLVLQTFDIGFLPEARAYKLSRDNPGDFLVPTPVHQMEESRGPPETAHVLVNGAKVRQAMEDRIRVFAEYAARLGDPWVECPHELSNPPTWRALQPGNWFHENENICTELRKGADHPMLRTAAQRDAWKKKLDALRAAAPAIIRAWSPITPVLRDLKAICDEEGARLLVVALPMDLQVSRNEWAKYGKQAPLDMAPTRILIDDVISSAEALGALALDVTPALVAAEPGAFLHGDIHMTPKGQLAVAQAIAGKLAAKP